MAANGCNQGPKYAGVQPREWKCGGEVKRKWRARISSADGITKTIGTYDDAETAAKAYDEAARALRGSAAHGYQPARSGFGGPGQPVAPRRFLLNFPTPEEEGQLKAELENEAGRKAMRKRELARSVVKRCSAYYGVTWVPGLTISARPWKATIRARGKTHSLGRYRQEEAAARAYDATARRFRGPSAHIGDTRNGWSLNFPTQAERQTASREAAKANVRRQRRTVVTENRLGRGRSTRKQSRAR